jgi:Putative prokaryotic signal transducing protein
MAEEPELVTVGRYGETFEAELAKGRLDSAGIPNFLVGENAALLYGTGLGGLLLQVRPQDEADAKTILTDPGLEDAGPPDADSADSETTDSSDSSAR